MDAWETLISGSTISSGDAWEHLNAQGGGVGSLGYVEGIYSIEYAGEQIELITYVAQTEQAISYVAQEQSAVTYVGELEPIITYIEQEEIGVTIICNP